MTNLSDKRLEILWKQLGDIPINDYEEIDEDFYIWEKGTNRYDIWQWFDYNHSLGLAKGLMKY